MPNVLVLHPDWAGDNDYYSTPEAPECPEDQLDGTEVLVCAGYYAYGDYEGTGEALVILVDGRAALVGLGHCSCYGPWEDFSINDFQDYLELKSNTQNNPTYWESVRHLFEYCEANFAQNQ